MGDLRDQDGINANDESQIHIEKVINNYLSGQLNPATRSPAETKLLRAIAGEVDGRLRQSLHNRVYVELDKVEDPQWVRPPWSGEVKVGELPVERCPEGTEIVEVFDRGDIRGQLLILGAPGSGKTTLLLQLAKVLVARAVEDASKPVPVLLNLSAWTEKFRDIPSWMVADLKQKYGVRKDVAEQWIEDGRILPLLDGLDELMSERQETCVQALNRFLPQWAGVPLVVCSRLEEYGIYESDLNLNGAVIVQPLSDCQIERFLGGAGCGELWEAVREDGDVMDPVEGLARSPLLLTVLVLASDRLPMGLWRPRVSQTEQRRILFEKFVQKCLERGGLIGAKSWAWLGWLATNSIKQSKTEFFIEALQPFLLRDVMEILTYKLFSYFLVVIPVTVIFVIFQAPLMARLLSEWTIDRLIRNGCNLGIPYSSLFVILYEVVQVRKGDFLRIPVGNSEPLEFKGWRKVIDSLRFATVLGLSMAFVSSLITLVFSSNKTGWLPIATVEGIQVILVWIIFNSFGHVTEAEISRLSRKPNHLIWENVKRATICCFGLMPVLLPVQVSVLWLQGYSEMLSWLKPDNFFILVLAVFSIGYGLGGMVFGLYGYTVIRHLALRITLWLFGYSPWNYSKFLRYCTRLGFLQRVGGGYRFTHALLRDHFAEHYNTIRPLKPTR